MSSRESGPGERVTGQGGHLADVLPIDRTAIESLSWALGSRITADSDGGSVLELFDPASGSALAVFEATEYTHIVRFRTPVGREKFFGVAAADLRPMVGGLLERDDWTVRCGRPDAI